MLQAGAHVPDRHTATCLHSHLIWPAFLRSMIDPAKSARALHHHIRLNREFRADLLWWATFDPLWNGSCLLHGPHLQDGNATICPSARGHRRHTGSGLQIPTSAVCLLPGAKRPHMANYQDMPCGHMPLPHAARPGIPISR